MPYDELEQARQLREDLRALARQYPELTRPAAKKRLEDYLQTEEENPMPAKDDPMLGEDLAVVTFRIPQSALEVVDRHLRMLQRTSRRQRIGKSDAYRDIFLRGIDTLEHPPQPSPVAPAAPAYEARVLTSDLAPEEPPDLTSDLEVRPLEPTDMTQESAVPAAPAETVTPPPDLAPEAPPRGDPDWSLASTWAQAFHASPLEVTQESPAPAAPAETVTPPRAARAARPKAAAKPKKSARTPKGRK